MNERRIVRDALDGSGRSIWVLDADRQYTVYVDGSAYATADSSYPRTSDGLSLAEARLRYLAGSNTAAQSAAFADSMAQLRDDSREVGQLMSELAGRKR